MRAHRPIAMAGDEGQAEAARKALLDAGAISLDEASACADSRTSSRRAAPVRPTPELEAEGTRDVEGLIHQGKQFLAAGADMIMIESEGITENVNRWRTDVITPITSALGLEKVMCEAADPEVFAWYIKDYGPEINLFVDHSQIIQLEALRSRIWGTKSLWGRILTYKD